MNDEAVLGGRRPDVNVGNFRSKVYMGRSSLCILELGSAGVSVPELFLPILFGKDIDTLSY